LGNDDWFNRIENADERAGGLNIEGLSTTGDDISESLYVGIKDPCSGRALQTQRAQTISEPAKP
jgi:hypothetical protein